MESERQVFISAMIIRCGLNPEILARRVEETGERVDYKMGGISIFPDGDDICARVDHYIFDGILNYRWKKDETRNNHR